MVSSDHILEINDKMSGLLKEFESLKSDGHLKDKAVADMAIEASEYFLIRFRNEILKQTS